ncbi:dephospho-CoA kinase [Beijerinckia indica]|uniref:Dephospho-CoA kinase n=1 Tax=Beijerinckia indica subsp. indica (strain ATCC 9039 / DSM 1715 / NCIMB 8712) TaxID=395963 RepID=B2ICZ2_BEII9|nr:dephospho-CoA kinase [Beijerinckia indica]ACB96757.1 dephospho-CoA kinase [Beijerinckia indica subsp. indica ATCC 9039]
MVVLGLTGSIGMGKSATAAMFRKAGIPVHDADATVHALYRGDAVPLVEAAFPGVSNAQGIDRALLGARVFKDPAAMQRLEAIIHPLVARARETFLAHARAEARRIVVLDIPLLMEIGADADVDAVVLVTAPEAVQKARVAAREGMTEERLAVILAKQMPDAAKRLRSHFLIDTSRGFAAAERQVADILRAAVALGGKRAITPHQRNAMRQN